jgi:hypothetical protein
MPAGPKPPSVTMSAMTLRSIWRASIVFIAISAVAQNARLSSPADYRKYIDPLLTVADFGIHYYDDGAADASVLFPMTNDNPYERPRQPVLDLVRLGERGLPLLIDCLGDTRVTNVVFDGSRITRPMKVPVGYVCLDILMGVTRGKPASNPDCSDDGLGACMNDGFYFRPDDYSRCWQDTCVARPWIGVVQRKWRDALSHHRLKTVNPYDALQIPEYDDFRTRRK